MIRCQLVEHTRHLLSTTTKTHLEIHHGANVPLYWIAAFKAGKSKNPGVNYVERLYVFLSGKDLV